MNKIILTIFLFCFVFCAKAFAIEDEFASITLINSKKPTTHTNYNYSSTRKIPIKMNLIKDYGNEKEVYEGQKVKLKIREDVVCNNEIIIKKDEIITAEIGIIISTGMNGIPASVILKNFEIENVPKSKLSNTYELFGQDRSLIVFPLKWALTWLPPTGSLTNFIMGGHVRLKPRKKITIYYFPEWE